MQSLYDVLGSMMIGGIILLMLLQFNATVMEGAAAQTFTSIVQSNLTAMADLVEYDFRKIGYLATGVADSAVVYADSNKITFKGDIDDNGTLDVVTYAFDRNKASGHQNPRSRILYRTKSGSPTQDINLGLTRFRLVYYDKNNVLIAANPVPDPSSVRSIRVTMDVESTAPYDTTYQGATWTRTIAPKNIK